MTVPAMLWRNMKWRFQNPVSILITLGQPLIWLLLYSTMAGQTMTGMGISNYTAFILPGLLILVSFGACASGGILNYLMKSQGSFQRLLTAPVSRCAIVLGQLLEAVLCALLESAILFAVSLCFSVRLPSFTLSALMVLLLSLSAFFMAGIAYTVSLLLPNEMLYETVMNAIVLPLFFLSPALFPAQSFSGRLALAVDLNPFTHVINALRRLMEGAVPGNMGFVLSLFAVLCMGSFILALLRLRVCIC